MTTEQTDPRADRAAGAAGEPPLFFAPMEGLTGYTFRRLHHRMFPGADRYYAPFVSVGAEQILQNREKADIDPVNNEGIPLVPQVLTNHAEAFVWACGQMARRSYREVNLNLGCPSGTVTARRKGAGFLADLDALDRFFENVFDGLENARSFAFAENRRTGRLRAARAGERPCEESGEPGALCTPPVVSVKTRVGVRDVSEAEAICALYNRYPIGEVIVHPRVQKQMYTGTADVECFAAFLENSVHPVVYNGDIRTAEDGRRIMRRFGACGEGIVGVGASGSLLPGAAGTAAPGRRISGIMIGRGLLANPALIRELRGGAKLSKEELEAYHEALYQDYSERMTSELHVLHKMKEMWSYLGERFEGGQPYVHKILMAKRGDEYRNAVRRIFAECGVQ
ncbi:tRNA dihydrouridine synthase [Lachnoclostridium sp. Marseille-P6806]|uniref:tRNA dihydrouridine synthase n=1 Tax=Lachnoclostridium sp. Marseille-P6806 TaxID=2364793 RepID=UPI0013EF47B2|nr:tRNA-dihydrouridine synthase family protein [Lachnoclostridium sp. Marseille-P6806]